MGVGKTTLIPWEGKHQVLRVAAAIFFRQSLHRPPQDPRDLMAALRRIEKIGDRAEDDDDTRAEQRHDRNHDDGDDGQNQGIFDQGLPFFAGQARAREGSKRCEDSSHLRKSAEIIFKKLHQRVGFDNERDSGKEIKPIRVSARDLREWNCSNL